MRMSAETVIATMMGTTTVGCDEEGPLLARDASRRVHLLLATCEQGVRGGTKPDDSTKVC